MTAELSIAAAAHRGDLAALRLALPLWERSPLVRGIVVTAWDGAPLRELLDRHRKLAVVEAGSGESFRPGLARNLAIEATSGPVVLALDPDVAPRDPAELLPTLGAAGAFVAIGSAASARSAAQILFRRADWAECGGFHEWLVGRGFEGEEFATRLAGRGLAHRFFAADALVRVADGGAPLADGDRAPIGFDLPPGLWRAPAFVEQRNRVLGGIAPWAPPLALLRPRRIGGDGSGPVRQAALAPAATIERRLLDWSSFITARFGHDIDEERAQALLRPLLEAREERWRVDAARQRQIERARRHLGRAAEPWR